MAEPRPKIRLYLDAVLQPGSTVALDRRQAHYLVSVMRLTEGAAIAAFNGRDGEWRGVLQPAGRKAATLRIEAQIAPQTLPPDLWLVFAPIRKARTDFIVEKATELGARLIQPVITRFTRSDRLNIERLRAHAIEAAEQCGGVFVPEIAEPQSLVQLLEGWPAERRLIFCDESRDAPMLSEAAAPAPAAILIGPEGGFSTGEAAALKTHPNAIRVSLGPRILRADTAVCAAIALWQAKRGDWG